MEMYCVEMNSCYLRRDERFFKLVEDIKWLVRLVYLIVLCEVRDILVYKCFCNVLYD